MAILKEKYPGLRNPPRQVTISWGTTFGKILL